MPFILYFLTFISSWVFIQYKQNGVWLKEWSFFLQNNKLKKKTKTKIQYRKLQKKLIKFQAKKHVKFKLKKSRKTVKNIIIIQKKKVNSININ